MQSTDKSHYHLNVKFPRWESYNVDYILSIISATKQPVPCSKICEECNEWFEIIEPPVLLDGSVNSAHCINGGKKRQEYRNYLTNQLFHAVMQMSIKFWNIQLDMIQPIPTSLGKGPSWDASVYHWAKKVFIHQQSLLDFCESENIHVLFNDQDGVVAGQAVGTQKKLAAPNGKRGEVADYRQLAKAFNVCPGEDENLTWFRDRCSNVNRNPAFLAALHERGMPGKKTRPSTFYVLQIAAHLEKKKNFTITRLQSVMKVHFPMMLDDFNTYFG